MTHGGHYRVYNVPGAHSCQLPSPVGLKVGTEVQCTDLVLSNGQQHQCARIWRVTNTTVQKRWYSKPEVTGVTWTEVIPDYTW